MASSAMRILRGMARQYRVGGRTDNGGRHSALPLVSILSQRGKRREGMRIIIACAGSLEHGSGFAWVGINAQHQEFGRDRSKIDRALDQDFGCILKRDFEFCRLVSGLLRRRHEDKID